MSASPPQISSTDMDTDPLADAPPPRYTLESDSEEDEHPSLSSAAPPKPHTLALRGSLPPGLPLLLASGAPSGPWASGASLGEQTGALFIDSIQVGLLFSPTWTRANVLVSEATARIPLSAMAPYAAFVLGAAQPSSIAIIAEYAAPAYASPAPIAVHDAPLRVLSTGAFSDPAASPFAPPNLLTGTPAAFLAAASFPIPSPSTTRTPPQIQTTSTSPQIQTTITTSSPPSSTTQPPPSTTSLLLPSPHIPAPAPRAVVHTGIFSSTSPSLSDDAHTSTPYAPTLIADAHRLAFAALGEPAVRAWALHPSASANASSGASTGDKTGTGKARRARDTGEGGMYI